MSQVLSRCLLDTSVILDLRRGLLPSPVKTRLSGISPEDCCLSVVTVGEIFAGLEVLPDRRKRTDLSGWLRNMQTIYGD